MEKDFLNLQRWRAEGHGLGEERRGGEGPHGEITHLSLPPTLPLSTTNCHHAHTGRARGIERRKI